MPSRVFAIGADHAMARKTYRAYLAPARGAIGARKLAVEIISYFPFCWNQIVWGLAEIGCRDLRLAAGPGVREACQRGRREPSAAGFLTTVSSMM